VYCYRTKLASTEGSNVGSRISPERLAWKKWKRSKLKQLHRFGPVVIKPYYDVNITSITPDSWRSNVAVEYKERDFNKAIIIVPYSSLVHLSFIRSLFRVSSTSKNEKDTVLMVIRDWCIGTPYDS
jgi:hypothetical protein